jgi:hypothetical protein
MAVENAGETATDAGVPEEILVPEGQEEQARAERAAPDVESFARRLGWRPKEEFKPPANRPNAEWMDADAFVERVQSEAPLRNERLRFQDQMLAKQDTQIKELSERLEKLTKVSEEQLEHTRTAHQRGFMRAREELERRMDEAAANGDREAYQEAKRGLISLHDQAPPRPSEKKTEEKKPDPPAAQPVIDPATTAFMAENPWAVEGHPNFNKPMYLFALGLEEQIGRTRPGLSTAERLAAVKEEMRKEFPTKFSNPNRDRSAAVATPGTAPRAGANKKAKTEADLPAEDRAVMERLVRAKALTKEQYLKDYNW